MTKELQKQIAEFYAKLPPNLQQSFSDMSWMDKLEKISNKYKLDEEGSKLLTVETSLALLGVTHVEELGNTLLNGLEIDDNAKENLLDDIYTNIVGDFRDDLDATFIKNAQELEEKETAQDTVPLPPYSKIVNKKNEDMQENPSTSRVQEAEEEKEEENVLQKNGVEISKEEIEKIPLPKKDFLHKESKTLIDSGIDLFEEERGGENKNNLLKDKIINTSITTHNTSDRSNDSYREPIE